MGGNDGPAPFAAGISLQHSTYAPLLKNPEKMDLAYHVTKFNIDRFLPSWTGYNQLLAQVEVPPRSVIGYLPVIDGSPTDMNAVLTILQKSVQIADKLDLETIVIVMDQAIYSKAQLIRWKNAQFNEEIGHPSWGIPYSHVIPGMYWQTFWRWWPARHTD